MTAPVSLTPPCEHGTFELVRTEGIGTWQVTEFYKCTTPGCTAPEWAVNGSRDSDGNEVDECGMCYEYKPVACHGMDGIDGAYAICADCNE